MTKSKPIYMAIKRSLAELWDEHPTTPEKEIRSILGGFLFEWR